MQELTNLLYEFGVLRRHKRTYHLFVMDQTESIAEHSHRVIAIAYFLARKANADAKKVILMAAFHDMPESRTGDSDWLQKNYLQQDEEKALNLQLDPLGALSEELNEILKEYKERKTLESQLTKDADNIEYIMSLKEIAHRGNKEAERRLNSENTSPDKLYTDVARELAQTIKDTDPTEWTRADLINTHKKYKVSK